MAAVTNSTGWKRPEITTGVFTPGFYAWIRPEITTTFVLVQTCRTLLDTNCNPILSGNDGAGTAAPAGKGFPLLIDV
jgi:hypothetical protein